MVEKHYSNDWAKTKSRDLVREMIRKSLLNFRKPKDLRVLCFPGIDAQEVFEVYDPLGIPRRNITGLEIDPRIASEIRRKNLGIDVVADSLENYCRKSSNLDFNVMSFDFTGPLTYDIIETYREICKKQKNEKFVLHSANLARRDKNSFGLYASCQLYLNGERSRTKDKDGTSFAELLSAQNGVTCAFEKLENKLVKKDSFSDVREESYSYVVGSGFSGVTTDIRNQKLRLVLSASSPHSYECEISRLSKMINRIIPTAHSLNIDPANPFESVAKHPEVGYFLTNMTTVMYEYACKNAGVNTEEFKGILRDSLNFWINNKFFFPKERRSYSYISESGSPMIGDIILFGYPQGMVSASHHVLRALNYPNQVKLSSAQELARGIIYFDKEMRKFYGGDCTNEELDARIHPKREYLGSSSRPVLSKKRFIEELEAGKDIEDIKVQYRGWENKPLAQWKAHYTMGTYHSRDMTEEAREDSGLEKITKEEVIDLLSSGIPVSEIHAAYPTSFSLGQLRAYKAHITMNSYQESKEEAVV